MEGIISGRLESILVFIAIYIILTFSVWIPFRAGLLWVAQPGYMAIGAYISAMTSREWGFPFILSMLLGVACSVAVAIIFGIPCLRFKTRALGIPIVSIGFFEIVRVCAHNFPLFGGSMGYPNIPFFSHTLPVSWFLVLIIVWFMSRLMNSRLGRAIEAMHDDEEAAASLGVNLNVIKLLVWVLSSILAALGGVLYAHYITYLKSTVFSFHLLVSICLFAVAGGMTTYWGPVAGTIILWLLPELTRELAQWRGTIYSCILIIIILFRPNGIVTKNFIIRIKAAIFH